MDWWIIFLTGLTTGGLSCLAMQGGLLSSVIANQKEEELEELNRANSKRKRRHIMEKYGLGSFDLGDLLPVGVFLLSKLAIHTVFGFLLGVVGSAITLSLNVRLIFQTFTALFMFATAMNLLDVHPIFRYMAFQPPRFVQRWIRNFSKRNENWDTGSINRLFAPAILGLMTIFIPCGVTQAMEILAINTGSPAQGGIIMFAFVLGTTPLFAVLGVATAKLSEKLKDSFMQTAAYVLVFMALYALNGVLVVLDAPVTWQKFYNSVFSPPAYLLVEDNYTVTDSDLQRVNLEVHPTGYSPEQFSVKAGIPVELTLNSNGVYSCALAFTFREFGIFETLNPTDSKTVSFTPTKPGRYIFSCSMGMYVGYMNVI